MQKEFQSWQWEVVQSWINPIHPPLQFPQPSTVSSGESTESSIWIEANAANSCLQLPKDACRGETISETHGVCRKKSLDFVPGSRDGIYCLRLSICRECWLFTDYNMKPCETISLSMHGWQFPTENTWISDSGTCWIEYEWMSIQFDLALEIARFLSIYCSNHFPFGTWGFPHRKLDGQPV